MQHVRLKNPTELGNISNICDSGMKVHLHNSSLYIQSERLCFLKKNVYIWTSSGSKKMIAHATSIGGGINQHEKNNYQN